MDQVAKVPSNESSRERLELSLREANWCRSEKAAIHIKTLWLLYLIT